MYLNNLIADLPGEPVFVPGRVRDRNRIAQTEKLRELQVPNKAMRELHQRLKYWLRSLPIALPHATGIRPGSSVRRNIEPHRGHRYFYLLDLEGAYQSVDPRALARVLRLVDLSLEESEQEIEEYLFRYCFVRGGGLATGANASPDLFNLYAAIRLDDPIGELALMQGWTYTRYVDDLTISGTEPITETDRRNLRAIVASAGFEVSHHKSRVYDLAKGPVTITGVGLKIDGRIFLPRHYLRRIRGALHLAEKGEFSPFRLAGMMSAFWMATDRKGMNASERRLAYDYERFRINLRGVDTSAWF